MRCEECGQVSCVCERTKAKKENWVVGRCAHDGCDVRIRFLPGVHPDVQVCRWCASGRAVYCRTCQPVTKKTKELTTA